jgi:hypothetical protein
MTLEERLRDGLHGAPTPPALVPPTDLADTVLREAGRRRRRGQTLVAVAAAVVALVVVGVPVARWQARATGSAPASGADRLKPTEPPKDRAGTLLPTPGGGPRTIHVYHADGPRPATYLLDLDSRRYREVPYPLQLSPDLKLAAISTADRTGLVDRAKLLRDGKSAITWLDLPPGNGLAWSPDGKALLLTSLSKATNPPTFTAHRYDVATGKVTSTPIAVNLLGGSVGWAADSRRYLALLAGKEGRDTIEPGALQYIEPNGTPGERIDLAAGLVGGAGSYSPSGKYLIADASGLMSSDPLPSKVIAVKGGTLVATLRAGARPVGWHDDRTVAQLAGSPDRPALELVDVVSGAVRGRVALPAAPGPITVQLGSSAGLTGSAKRFGF